MFRSASSFNQPLNSWNTASVRDMYKMLHRASSFNQPLNKWDVSSITTMNEMGINVHESNAPDCTIIVTATAIDDIAKHLPMNTMYDKP